MPPMPTALRTVTPRLRLALILLAAGPVSGAAQVSGGFSTSLAMATDAAIRAFATPVWSIASYAGRDDNGVPRYIERPFTDEERRLLRDHFGIGEPGRLYLSDTTGTAYLNYDTERDPGAGKLVRSYRVGAESVRLPGETWEELERRLAATRPADFPASARVADTALASLDPEARPAFERMLAAARRAGHRVKVVETHRTPERQAYLMASGGGLTFTATSKHSSGRAVDLIVGDGNLKNARTRARWTAFRRWVTTFEGGRFRLIGAPNASWDWPHVELAGPLGYRSIEALLLAAARAEQAQTRDSLGGDVIH
jgi:D-alanyl-D-alanine carboxypeptidase